MNEQHWSYIAFAYAVTFVTVGAVALRIVLDYRRLRDELARLEAMGVEDEGDAS